MYTQNFKTILSPLQWKLLEKLEANGAMQRSELVFSVDAPRTTVYDNLTRMQNSNIIMKYSKPNNTLGRPPVFFKLVSNIDGKITQNEYITILRSVVNKSGFSFRQLRSRFPFDKIMDLNVFDFTTKIIDFVDI